MGHYLPLEEVEHYLIAKGKPLKVLRQEEMGRWADARWAYLVGASVPPWCMK